MRLSSNALGALFYLSALISVPPVLFDPPPLQYTIEALMRQGPSPYALLWLLVVFPVTFAAILHLLDVDLKGEALSVEDLLYEAICRYPRLVAAHVVFCIALVAGLLLFILPGLYLLVLMPIYFCHVAISDAPLLACLKEARKMLRGRLGLALLVEGAAFILLVLCGAATLLLHRFIVSAGAGYALVLLHGLSGTLTTALSLWAAMYLYDRVRPARVAPPPPPAPEALWL